MSFSLEHRGITYTAKEGELLAIADVVEPLGCCGLCCQQPSPAYAAPFAAGWTGIMVIGRTSVGRKGGKLLEGRYWHGDVPKVPGDMTVAMSFINKDVFEEFA